MAEVRKGKLRQVGIPTSDFDSKTRLANSVLPASHAGVLNRGLTEEAWAALTHATRIEGAGLFLHKVRFCEEETDAVTKDHSTRKTQSRGQS